MADQLLLAVDAGSSFMKTALFDRQGRLVAGDKRPYATRSPRPGRQEQDPDAWLDLIAGQVRGFLDGGIVPQRIAGIALSARGANAVFLDAHGTVLAPCWLDRRHAEEARELAALVGEVQVSQTRSLAPKTYHLRRHHPEAFARLAHPLFLKDFLLYRLTGELATDPSSGPPEGVWPARLWQAVGVPLEQLAPVRPHTAIGGCLTPAAAMRLGLPAGLPVGVGGHDGACANIGAGAIMPGQSCLTLGTQGVVRTITATRPAGARERRIFPYHFLPGRWCCSGNLPATGAAPTLVAHLLTTGATSAADLHAGLTSEAGALPPGSHGVGYLPFPSGQDCPELRLDARAAFLGMQAGTSRAELYRATLEGAAYAFRAVLERQREVGLAVDDLRLSGGGAGNPLWVRILADVLAAPITVVEPEEGTRGAALLLAAGLGWYATLEVAAADWLRSPARVEPSPEAAAYDRLYRRYRHLADAVYAAERSAPL